MSLIVRSFRREDADTVADLMRRSVSELAPRDYDQEQVDVWLRRLPDAASLNSFCADGRIALVVTDAQDVVAGFADLEEDGHIQFLFCAPESAGQGVGGTLCEALEQHARERDLPRLYVEASEGARGLFLRKGFALLHRRDFTLEGVAVHNYAMEKFLRP